MNPSRGGRITRFVDEFEGIRKHRPDMPLILFICTLVLLGLIVIYSISPALIARISSSETEISQHYFLFRQLIYIAIGGAAFAIAAFVPLGWWRKNSLNILIVGIILGTLPFLLQATPLALCVNGACRWLDLGIISFQPAEVMKLALLVFLASFLAARVAQGELNDIKQTFVPLSVLLITSTIVIVGLQKDLGTGLTLFAIALIMLFMAGVKLKFFAMLIGLVVGLGVIFILLAPHRMERILTYFNHSSSTTTDMGYHENQALIAIGSGGMTGKGLGRSIQAFGYLPEAANDSIFAILAEKFGFLGTVAVLGLFGGMFWRMLKIMDQTSQLFPKLVIAGTFGWVFSHSIINVGAMLGIFPLTGITLPFVSFGGTSLLCMLAALGLVIQISRYTRHNPTQSTQGGTDDNFGGRRRIGRARNTGFSGTA
ncbi:MAG TPA: putative peptidoglycan glycosyltransferase FtsW [Candidatus Saccharimonadales bacterium]|nr:putative peptidoglycan glycosyltransferase FtsW [Candidatus Saccharimonadales bacterium]